MSAAAALRPAQRSREPTGVPARGSRRRPHSRRVRGLCHALTATTPEAPQPHSPPTVQVLVRDITLADIEACFTLVSASELPGQLPAARFLPPPSPYSPLTAPPPHPHRCLQPTEKACVKLGVGEPWGCCSRRCAAPPLVPPRGFHGPRHVPGPFAKPSQPPTPPSPLPQASQS